MPNSSADDLLNWYKHGPSALAGNGSVLMATGALDPVKQFYQIVVSSTP